MNLSELTNEELEAHRVEVLIEQERRAAMANIPGQISQLAAQYEAGGGDRADLTSALNN